MIYEALVRELKGDIWPEGVPENLVGPINNSIEAAITHVQRYVPCLQNRHINRYPQCSTYFQGGKTVLDAPKGRIDKLYTILDEASEEVYPSVFEQVTKEQLECESIKHLAMAFPPPNVDMAVLPLGKKYPEEDSDYLVDSTGAKLSTLKKHGRAVIGRWAIERDKIYVSPWINSDELVVVEWDGIKTRFSGEDAVCDDSDFKRAVKLFVMREHARDFDSDYERYRYVTVDFHEALGDLIHECLQETQVRKTFPCAESYDVLAARRN